MIAALLAASALISLPDDVRAMGWTPDGAHFAVLAAADAPQVHVEIVYVFDTAAGLVGRYRGKREGEGRLPKAVERAWRLAARSGGSAWLERKDLASVLVGNLPGAEEEQKVDDAMGIRLEAAKAKGKGCRSVRLLGTLGTVSRMLAEDPCAGSRSAEQRNDGTVIGSPDGKTYAVLWTSTRGTEAASRRQTRLVIFSRGDLAAVDLLDAGGGPARVGAVQKALSIAGLPIAHKGRAVSRRAKSAVFFNRGFEAEAELAAKVVGVAPQPTDFKSPYAVTIALGKGR